MKKVLILGVTALLLFGLAGCGAFSVVDKNSDAFGEAVKKISTDEVILNSITSFEWDTMYTFTPYTSKENMEKIIGFKSNDIHETVNEGMNQLIFVKDETVVCSIYGYSSNLGYYISFGFYDGNYLAINSIDNALFAVENANEIITLTYTK